MAQCARTVVRRTSGAGSQDRANQRVSDNKAFDSNWIIETLNERGAKIVISQHPRRTNPLEIDTEMSKWRHLI